MPANDVDPDRGSTAAQQARAQRFLDQVPDELRVGFVGYSTAPHTVERPTRDHDDVASALDGLTADGGDRDRRRADAALDRLEARRGKARATAAPAAIVLLSDGKTTEGRDPSSRRRARRAS